MMKEEKMLRDAASHRNGGMRETKGDSIHFSCVCLCVVVFFC